MIRSVCGNSCSPSLWGPDRYTTVEGHVTGGPHDARSSPVLCSPSLCERATTPPVQTVRPNPPQHLLRQDRVSDGPDRTPTEEKVLSTLRRTPSRETFQSVQDSNVHVLPRYRHQSSCIFTPPSGTLHQDTPPSVHPPHPTPYSIPYLILHPLHFTPTLPLHPHPPLLPRPRPFNREHRD